MNIPQREDKRPINVYCHYYFSTGLLKREWFVDAERDPPRHSCRMKEYGLKDHLRCVICGKCKERALNDK